MGSRVRSGRPRSPFVRYRGGRGATPQKRHLPAAQSDVLRDALWRRDLRHGALESTGARGTCGGLYLGSLGNPWGNPWGILKRHTWNVLEGEVHTSLQPEFRPGWAAWRSADCAEDHRIHHFLTQLISTDLSCPGYDPNLPSVAAVFRSTKLTTQGLVEPQKDV